MASFATTTEERARTPTRSLSSDSCGEMGQSLTHRPEHRTDPKPIAGTQATDFEKFLTRELYAGTRRNIDFGGAYILNEEYYDEAGTVHQYTDPGEHRNHFLFLQGSWQSTEESLEYAATDSSYDGYIGFRFFANEVNAVLDHVAGESSTSCTVTAPGLSVRRANQYDDEGNSSSPWTQPVCIG